MTLVEFRAKIAKNRTDSTIKYINDFLLIHKDTFKPMSFVHDEVVVEVPFGSI